MCPKPRNLPGGTEPLVWIGVYARMSNVELSPRRVHGPIISFSNGQILTLESRGSDLANSLLGQTLLNLKTSFKTGGMTFCAKTGYLGMFVQHDSGGLH